MIFISYYSSVVNQLCIHVKKADHPLFDWLINCVILNNF